jgi:parallel beta-helix repeat protein
VVFRNNFVHHNAADGIWYDTGNVGVLVEGNRVEDNGREGISHEVGGSAIIRNNTIRRNKSSGIFVATSKNTEIYGNTLEDNYRGIQFFLNCAAVGGGTLKYDLYNVYAHDNSVRVPTTSGAWGNALSYISSCTTTQVAPYLNGSKSLRFVHNTYRVPSLMTKYWMWGLMSFRYWVEWQNLGQDQTGAAIDY